VISIDEISIRKGHTYWIVVSDLVRERPIWFSGEDRSQVSMSHSYHGWGSRIHLAVTEMWKPFRLATKAYAPPAAILFDKFHVMRHLGDLQERVWRPPAALHQGPEIRIAVALGEPNVRGQKGVEDVIGR
jgi:transposase